MAHACETSRRRGKETKSVLLLCRKGDQSKEGCEENGKETSEEVKTETKKEVDLLAPGEAGKTVRISHGVEGIDIDPFQRCSEATY